MKKNCASSWLFTKITIEYAFVVLQLIAELLYFRQAEIIQQFNSNIWRNYCTQNAIFT